MGVAPAAARAKKGQARPAAVALALAAGAALFARLYGQVEGRFVEALQSLSKMTGLEEEGALLLRVGGNRDLVRDRRTALPGCGRRRAWGKRWRWEGG